MQPRPTARIVTSTLLALLLAGGLFGGMAGPVAADSSSIQAKQAQLQEVRKRIHEVAADMAADRKTQSSLQVKLRETEQHIAKLAGELHQLDVKAGKLEHSVAMHAQERASASAKLDQQRKFLREELRASYKNGQQQKIKLLLNQQDPSRVGRMLTYFHYLSQAHRERMQGIEKQVALLRAVEQKLSAELGDLKQVRTERSAALADLRKTRDARNQQLALINQHLQKSGGTLHSLKNEEAALTRLLESLKRNLNDIPAEFGSVTRFSRARGKLPWPVHGGLLASYGQRKDNSGLSWHGIWIKAKTGTPVRAVANGRVVYVGWMQRLGLIVVLQHEDGYYSIYGHNQSARVTSGSQVRAGTVIATVGNSGGHEQSGLYFEIRRGSSPENPRRWLERS